MKPVNAWGRLSKDLHDVQVLSDRNEISHSITTHLPGFTFR
jgi:hypothetical protein